MVRNIQSSEYKPREGIKIPKEIKLKKKRIIGTKNFDENIFVMVNNLP
jgi:hypothetical protein